MDVHMPPAGTVEGTRDNCGRRRKIFAGKPYPRPSSFSPLFDPAVQFHCLSMDKEQLLPKSYPMPHCGSRAGKRTAFNKAVYVCQGHRCLGVTEHISEEHYCNKTHEVKVLSLQLELETSVPLLRYDIKARRARHPFLLAR